MPLTEDHALVLLHVAGIGGGSVLGLTWRLRECRGMTDEEIARALNIDLGTVRSRICKANAALRWKQDEHARAVWEAGLPAEEEPESPPADDALQAGKDLLECVKNEQGGEKPGCMAAVPCAPVVSAWDAKEIIQGKPVAWLDVVGPPGENRNWREHVGTQKRES